MRAWPDRFYSLCLVICPAVSAFGKEVACRQFPQIFWLQLARGPVLPRRQIPLGRSLQGRPAFGKSWISGRCQDPLLIMPPATYPNPGGRQTPSQSPRHRPPRGALPPPRKGREANFGGRGLGASSGDHRGPARPAAPVAVAGAWRGRRANAKAAIRAPSSHAPGCGRLQGVRGPSDA